METWKKARAKWVKINVDAAVFGDGMKWGSVAAVAREEQGVVLTAKVERLNSGLYVQLAEAVAARSGIELALS